MICALLSPTLKEPIRMQSNSFNCLAQVSHYYHYYTYQHTYCYEHFHRDSRTIAASLTFNVQIGHRIMTAYLSPSLLFRLHRRLPSSRFFPHCSHLFEPTSGYSISFFEQQDSLISFIQLPLQFLYLPIFVLQQRLTLSTKEWRFRSLGRELAPKPLNLTSLIVIEAL